MISRKGFEVFASAAAMTALVAAVVVVSCGNRLPPPGGPEDKEAPVFQESVPVQGEVGVDTSVRISILFDEKIDKESAEKVIRLSPAHEGIEVKVKGERVELRPEGNLFENTTYQVTIGNRLLDQRGNSFAGPYTFYFSTGDQLDHGLIHGTVKYRDKAAGGAYVTAHTLPESVSYVVQADTSGKYRLAHLPVKSYSLFSFLDQNGNGKYRFAVEPMDEKKVEIFEKPLEVDFDIAVIDTSPPVFESVEPLDSTTLKLIFDDPMRVEPGLASPSNYRLFPERDSTAVVPLGSIQPDTSAIEVIILGTAAPLEDGVRYWIELVGVENESGLAGRPSGSRQKFVFYDR